MKVLDLFCGRGGWSKPFIEDGDEVWGIDIKDYGYPGKLIQSDIRELDGYGFSDMDLIIGSPPCAEFSIAKHFTEFRYPHIKRDIAKGLELVGAFERFVKEAQPRFYAMENVSQMRRYYAKPAQWHFMISAGGKRCLWTNIPIPLSPEYRFRRRLRDMTGWWPDRAKKAEIPYPIARFIADTVKSI